MLILRLYVQDSEILELCFGCLSAENRKSVLYKMHKGEELNS